MSLENMDLENISINSHAEISEHFTNRTIVGSNFIIGEMIMLYHKQGPVFKAALQLIDFYELFFLTYNSLLINIRTGQILLCK